MHTQLLFVPFPPNTALNRDKLQLRGSPTTSPDDAASTSLLDYIPGAPTIGFTAHEVHDFLVEELDTPLLHELYEHLWLVGRKSGASIDPLHRQIIKDRVIIPAEDPKLHLVWRRGRIYVKPIPLCLLNYEVWDNFLLSDATTKESTEVNDDNSSHHSTSTVLGFLRSYAFLIQHRSDFTLAYQQQLIPADVSWEQWVKFISNFRNIPDDQVSKRYHYGQLRLSRLNWITRMFRPRAAETVWFYEIPHWAILSYVESSIGPFIFVFASLSVVLSSMQVILSVPTEAMGFTLESIGIRATGRAFWGFSIATLLMSCGIWTLILVIPTAILGWQLAWGYRNRESAKVAPSNQP